jgi:surface antigen
MPSLKWVLALAAALAFCASAAAGGQANPESPADEAAPEGQAASIPSATAPVDGNEMLRQMSGQRASSATMSPQGRPRRRAPRFAPFGVGTGPRPTSEFEALRPGGAAPPTAETTMTAAEGGCSQELTDDQRAANRSEAQAMTDTLNRMAELAAQMSAMQARQNGAQVTMGAMPRLGASVTNALERALNCAEQRQAAEATERAIAAAPGTEVMWASESRPNVSGSSTVIAVENAAADGSQCLTVTDVIIIDGAETRAPKRMCRIPPSTRYVRT